MNAPTPGQVAYEARMASRAALLGRFYGIGQFNKPWAELDEHDQAHEEAGAQAVLDNRTPWGDVNAVSIEMYPRFAVVRSGPEDDDVVKVITYGDTGLTYFDSLEEWKRANEDEQRAADLRAHVSGMGGPSPAWVTDDAAGVAAEDDGERDTARKMDALDEAARLEDRL